MSLRTRAFAVVVLGAVAGVSARLLDPDGIASTLAVLGAALVLGELFELRPLGRAPLPVSLSVMVVLARVATVGQFVAVVIAGEVAASVLRPHPQSARQRLVVAIERLTEAGATLGTFRPVHDSLASVGGRQQLLVALGAAALAQLVVAEGWRLGRELARPRRQRARPLLSLQGRTADLTMIASGMLMAVGVRGVDGKGSLGLWGVLLFSVPLMAGCFAFERVALIRTVYDQTVRALSVVPELGGYVRPGHAERVAHTATSLGEELGMSRSDLEQLEIAARLHHLGQVCLDEPLGTGDGPDIRRIAKESASILRTTESLAAASQFVSAEPLLYRTGAMLPGSIALGGQILKIASAFDDLTEGDPDRAEDALDMLYSGPSYVYDGRVLAALERVLIGRGVLPARV